MRRLALALALALAPSVATAADTATGTGTGADAVPDFAQGIKPLKIDLTDDGTQWVRVINWVQVWARAMELNPGSTVQGEAEDWALDVGLRRARFMVQSQLGPRLSLLFHFGVDNQTFNSERHPQLYVHDAWAEVEAVPKALALGAGLLYWNGVSRMTNASTISMLALDAPILNWFEIEKADQFGRQLGLYAKGKLGLFDYRVALTRPFSVSGELVDGGPVDFRPGANTFAVAGYFQLQLGDIESNALPYATGTYLGAKSVFNVGLGFHWHPDAMGRVVDGAEEKHDLFVAAADVFLDEPLAGGALTGYLAFFHDDFGPDYTRNVGIMNVAKGGTSLNGAGNAYPVIGTGDHLYTQWGFLLPGEGVRLQPYATLQASFMERFDDPMVAFELGANLLLSGHNAKISLDWRNRPYFEASGAGIGVGGRANELILQLSFAR
ncbi:MAG: porin [Deltaproteobacteria bacterium]|nr:porin [Deltaproteobacteria bacterium]